MDHALLVPALVVGQGSRVRQLALQDRLAEARDVAVPEDPEDPLDQAMLDAVALGVLGDEEPDDRLSDGQAGRAHAGLPGRARLAIRPSTGVSRQVSRTQSWAGSKATRHARSSPGPAMTLR